MPFENLREKTNVHLATGMIVAAHLSVATLPEGSVQDGDGNKRIELELIAAP